MPITEEQRETRKKFLGSSDAAAVLGLDSFRSPLDVYYDKTNQIIPTGREPKNKAIEAGNYLEEAVIQWFGDTKGMRVVKNTPENSNQRLHSNGIMAANIDAFIENDPTQIIEAKTHGLISGFISEEWGEIETDQVPDRIKLQCVHQMAVLPEVERVWVPVLMGGSGFQYYYVDRNADMIADLESAETEFWFNHILTRVPPSGEVASIDTYKKLKRVPEKTVTLADEIVAEWLAAREAATAADKTKEEKTRLLLAALQDAESGTSSFGEVTYFLNNGRKAYAVEAKDPYRELRHKKLKGAGNGK